MFPWWLFPLSFYGVSMVQIGKIVNSIYIPQVESVNASIIFQFVMSCNECLCRALSSNTTYAVINCERNARWCSYYMNFSTNYTFATDVNSSVYLFQSSPIDSVAISTTSASFSTALSVTSRTSVQSTSKFLSTQISKIFD